MFGRSRSARRVPRCSDENKDSCRKNGTSGDRPPTTYRRLRYGRSALMQGLAFRKNHRNPRNPRNDNRRAMQGPAWLMSHLSHVSAARVTARMLIVIGFVTRVTPVTPYFLLLSSAKRVDSGLRLNPCRAQSLAGAGAVHELDPLARQVDKSREVRSCHEPLSFEAAHLARRCCVTV